MRIGLALQHNGWYLNPLHNPKPAIHNSNRQNQLSFVYTNFKSSDLALDTASLIGSTGVKWVGLGWGKVDSVDSLK